MTIKIKPKALNENIVVKELENEILVYELKNNQAFCLNQTSSLVWQFCDGSNSIAEISSSMSEKLKTDVSEDFILLTISELQKNNLIENKLEIEYFEGLTRREVIKRVGLSTMIALPIISSIVAPTSANAASGCIAGVTFPVPPGGNPPNVFANVVPFPLADNTTGCGQCLNLLNPQCCSGSVTNFSCSPAFPAVSYNCNALCA